MRERAMIRGELVNCGVTCRRFRIAVIRDPAD